MPEEQPLACQQTVSGGQSGFRNVGFFLHSRIVGPVLFLSLRLYSFYMNLNLDEAAHTSALPS